MKTIIRTIIIACAILLFYTPCFGQGTTSLVPMPKAQFFDNSGNPLAGGFVCTFAAGTTTPLVTYTDSTGGTPNSIPVVLDSAGRANIWLGTSPYKIVVYSAGGSNSCPPGGSSVLISSTDNVYTPGGTFSLASPPAIGNTVPNTGAFTTLSSTTLTATTATFSGTTTLSGNGVISSGLSSTATGWKTSRSTSGCATSASAGATCLTTITWGGTAFADTNYTPICTGEGVTSGVPLSGGITGINTSQVIFETVAGTAAAAQYTKIFCIAAHD